MPFSQSSQLSAIVGFMEALQPSSVLDVGVGMGQYGYLARMNLENVNLFRVEGTHGELKPKSEWRVRIDGIEGFRGYLTPVHDFVYNDIVIGDALEKLPAVADRSYDLVLAIDILEHFTTADGLRFLDQLKRIARRAALISTPKEFHAQEVEANPFENHRSHWSAQHLADAGYRRIIDNAESWIAVHTPS